MNWQRLHANGEQKGDIISLCCRFFFFFHFCVYGSKSSGISNKLLEIFQDVTYEFSKISCDQQHSRRCLVPNAEWTICGKMSISNSHNGSVDASQCKEPKAGSVGGGVADMNLTNFQPKLTDAVIVPFAIQNIGTLFPSESPKPVHMYELYRWWRWCEYMLQSSSSLDVTAVQHQFSEIRQT